MSKIRNTKTIVLVAMFCALAAVGANIKIQGSIAFDSAPAFLAAMLMGGPEGLIAGAVGHLFSALLAGFPLTLPLHFVVALEMGLICLLAGVLVKRCKWSYWLAGIVAFVLNAFVSPLIIIIWPGFGWGLALSLLPTLTIASAANVAIAVALAYALRKPYFMLMNVRKDNNEAVCKNDIS